MAPVFSGPSQLGSSAPDFSLPGVDGKVYGLKNFQNARALVVVFMCNHCPYVIAVQGRINRLAQETLLRGVQWVGINSNDTVRYPDDSFEAMKVRSQEQGFVFPYLYDETQQVAKEYGAVCTPEFYVYRNENGKFLLSYQGRLDDQWKDEKAVTRQELAMALEQLLAGQLPDSDQKPAMGCSIKWKL